MPINIVQSASNYATGNVPGTSQPSTVAAAFGSANTARNTLLVIAAAQCYVGGADVAFSNLSDSQGNTYVTQYQSSDAHYPGGPFVGLYTAKNCNAGANSVSFQATASRNVATISYDLLLAVFEMSGMPNPALQAADFTGAYFATLSDSHGVSVTTSWTNNFGSYQDGVLVADLLSAGADFFLTATISGPASGTGPPSVSPSTYMNYTQEAAVIGSGPMYVYFRTPPVPTLLDVIVQPRVFVVN